MAKQYRIIDDVLRGIKQRASKVAKEKAAKTPADKQTRPRKQKGPKVITK